MNTKKHSDHYEMQCANPVCFSVKFKVVVNSTATVWAALECTKCKATYNQEYFENERLHRAQH